MNNFWKLKREWQRLKQQLSARLFSKASGKQISDYEAGKSELVTLTPGHLPMGKNCAVFLLFQPDGIPKSVFKTCQFLRSQGMSVFAVSNAPLNENDLDRLKVESSLVMQRPNIGYDFGGYREGLIHFFKSGVDLENVLLLNDSIWFPAFEPSDLLRKLLACNADLAGPMMQVHSKKSERDHLQSYMIKIGRNALKNENFRQFWNDFDLPMNRHQAIRRGEMGLTFFARSHEMTIESLNFSDEIGGHLINLSDQDLQTALGMCKWTSRKSAREAKKIDFQEPNWRVKAEHMVLNDLRVSNPLSHHPAVLLSEMNLPYLKKDRHVPYQIQRSILKSGNWRHRLNPTIFTEIENWEGKSNSQGPNE